MQMNGRRLFFWDEKKSYVPEKIKEEKCGISQEETKMYFRDMQNKKKRNIEFILRCNQLGKD